METTDNPKNFILAQHASEEAHRAAEKERRAHEAAIQNRQAKLEMIRLAKDILAENARHQTTEYTPVTAAAVIAFAEELIQYVGD